MSSIGGTNVTISTVYEQWGSPGLSAFVLSILSIWILLANLFVGISVVATESLRRTFDCVFILHIFIADFFMGLLFAPLTVDYFVKGYWSHDCDFLFFYTMIPFFVSFLTTHAMALLNISQILGDCCRVEINLRRQRLLLFVIICLLWFYLAIMVPTSKNLATQRSEVSLTQDIVCVHNYTVDPLGAFVLSLFVYWMPALVSFVCLIIQFVRARKDLYTAERRLIPFKAYGCATAVSCLLPLPAFVAFMNVGTGVCTTYDCRVMNAIATTFLVIKSAIMPCIWLFCDDLRATVTTLLSKMKRQS